MKFRILQAEWAVQNAVPTTEATEAAEANQNAQAIRAFYSVRVLFNAFGS